MSAFYKCENEDLLLRLYVQPNATKDEIIGEYGQNLKTRITALPVDNKANKHLLKFLVKIFTVSISQLTLMKGENQRIKRVKILSPNPPPRINQKTLTDLN